jgi:hypothetical protein
VRKILTDDRLLTKLYLRAPQIRAEYKVRKMERDLRKARREHLNERGGGS